MCREKTRVYGRGFGKIVAIQQSIRERFLRPAGLPTPLCSSCCISSPLTLVIVLAPLFARHGCHPSPPHLVPFTCFPLLLLLLC